MLGIAVDLLCTDWLEVVALTPRSKLVPPLCELPEPATKVLKLVPVEAMRDHEPSGAVLVLVVTVSKLPFAKRSTGRLVVHVAVKFCALTLALATVTARVLGLKVQPDLLGVRV